METLMKADIFFFVTTIAVIAVTIGLMVALTYIIKILRNASHISDKVKEESDEIISDIKSLRGNVKAQGFKVQYVKQFIKRIFKKR